MEITTNVGSTYKIVTHNIYPPIPERKFDWCAFVDGHEEDGPTGYGRTEADAVADLQDLLDWR